MKISLHHCHLFASDLDASIRFYQDMFGAEVIFDTEVANARNVLISIGDGRINFYDQKPKDEGHGALHHIGINTDDINGLVEQMKSKGYKFRNPVKDFGGLKYVMIEGPDKILIEIFQQDLLDAI